MKIVLSKLLNPQDFNSDSMSKEDRVAGGILDENDKQNVGSPELFF